MQSIDPVKEYFREDVVNHHATLSLFILYLTVDFFQLGREIDSGSFKA